MEIGIASAFGKLSAVMPSSALQRLRSSSCSGDRPMTLQSGRQPSRSSKYLCSRNQWANMLKPPYGVGILMVSCAGTTVRFCIFVAYQAMSAACSN